jgi:hypothetical protein
VRKTLGFVCIRVRERSRAEGILYNAEDFSRRVRVHNDRCKVLWTSEDDDSFVKRTSAPGGYCFRLNQSPIRDSIRDPSTFSRLSFNLAFSPVPLCVRTPKQRKGKKKWNQSRNCRFDSTLLMVLHLFTLVSECKQGDKRLIRHYSSRRSDWVL